MFADKMKARNDATERALIASRAAQSDPDVQFQMDRARRLEAASQASDTTSERSVGRMNPESAEFTPTTPPSYGFGMPVPFGGAAPHTSGSQHTDPRENSYQQQMFNGGPWGSHPNRGGW